MFQWNSTEGLGIRHVIPSVLPIMRHDTSWVGHKVVTWAKVNSMDVRWQMTSTDIKGWARRQKHMAESSAVVYD
jgi:hypothetical protein